MLSETRPDLRTTRVSQYVIHIIRIMYYQYVYVIHNTRDGQIWYTRGNIIIHLYIYISSFPRAVNWGIRLTDHVAP